MTETLDRQAALIELSAYPHALHSIDFDGLDYTTGDDAGRVTAIEDANAFSSQLVGDLAGRHTLALDIDVPLRVIESSTPGHSHLYIDVPMTWDQYLAVIKALTDAGIVEVGYYAASERRGYTTLRLPWVQKNDEDLDRRLRCVGCNLHPSQIDEYTEYAEHYKVSNARYVLKNEGTLNRKNGHFYCTGCYIKHGMPLGVAE